MMADKLAKRTRRILIVDDDEDTLANLEDILSDVGYETHTACDGLVALSLVDGNCVGNRCGFDLCLLDFKMPGMDGVDLLEQLRCRSPELRAIMMTAYAGDDGLQRAVEAGTWKILRKPVDIKVLLGMIKDAVA